MRTLQNIRSDHVTLAHQSPAGGAAGLVLPLLALLILWAWLFAPLGGGGPLIVSVVLGGLGAWLIRYAWPRKVELKLPPDAVLAWENGLEDQDTYRVVLRSAGTQSVLLEHDNPERVLSDLRRLCRETGRRAEGPEFAHPEPAPAFSGGGRVLLTAGTEEGPRWLAQREAAWALVGAGVFVFLIFLGSVRWEAELTWFSAFLPLMSIAFLFLIAAVLFSLRVRVITSAERVQVHRVLLGRSRQVLDLPRGDLISAWAVGHAGHAPRHLLFDTVNGPRAVALAGNAARIAAERVRLERESQPARAVSREWTSP